jgi:hypothetical protein
MPGENGRKTVIGLSADGSHRNAPARSGFQPSMNNVSLSP